MWPKAESVVVRLKAALESAMSLELGPRGLLVFEDYAKGNTSGTHFAQRKGIPGRSDANCMIHLTVSGTPVSCACMDHDSCFSPGLCLSASESNAAASGAGLSHQHQCHCLLESQSWRYHRLFPGLLYGGPTGR